MPFASYFDTDNSILMLLLCQCRNYSAKIGVSRFGSLPLLNRYQNAVLVYTWCAVFSLLYILKAIFYKNEIIIVFVVRVRAPLNLDKYINTCTR